jgi:hypothetical protein
MAGFGLFECGRELFALPPLLLLLPSLLFIIINNLRKDTIYIIGNQLLIKMLKP